MIEWCLFTFTNRPLISKIPVLDFKFQKGTAVADLGYTRDARSLSV